MIDIAAAIDRSLPVPLGLQLRGLLEYGIACGELPSGARLPSVRELSESCGLAPMTVSGVYRDLRHAGLITARPGSGTFVADAPPVPLAANDAVQGFQTRVDDLISDVQAAGLTPAEFMALVNGRLALGRMLAPRRLRIRMVGVFEAATRAYAEDIGRHLRAGDQIDFTTIDTFASGTQTTPDADLYVTMANRRAEVAGLVQGRAPVVSVHFIPSEATRAQLATIDPMARVCVVSVFPEFLALMKPGVKRFTPHVRSVEAALLGDAALAGQLRAADVIVYATGAEAVLTQLSRTIPAIEYRHVPDPHAIQRELLPVIESVRARLPIKEQFQ